jgi:hypothetical protein
MKPAVKEKQTKKYNFGESSGFSIVTAEQAGDLCFEPKNRISPYLTALQSLAAAKKANPSERQFLCFDKLGARPSIYQCARKHNLKVMFAEKDGKLYVRLEEPEGPEAIVLRELADGPKVAAELAQVLGKNGHAAISLQSVVGPLSENGKIRLDSFNGVKKWRLAAV